MSMDEKVHLVLVGHSLEAKCEVGNALLKTNAFRELDCRTELEIKRFYNVTIQGENIACVVTPNLNTPGWQYVLPILRQFQKRVFIYVRTYGLTDVDDKKSIDLIRDQLSATKQRLDLIDVDVEDQFDPEHSFQDQETSPCKKTSYYTSASTESTEENAKTSVKPLNVIVIELSVCKDRYTKDTSKLTAEQYGMCLNFEMTPDEKLEVGKKILSFIKRFFESTQEQEVEPLVQESGVVIKHGTDAISGKGATDEGLMRQVSKPDDDDQPMSLSQKISDGVHKKVNLDSRSELPEITNEDRTLFAKTLEKGKARANHVRVNVVGNQGVGKTTLVQRLQRKKSTLPEKTMPTEALGIEEITCRCLQPLDDEKKKWETKESGYVQQLNVYRMAEAMASLTTNDDRDSSALQEEQPDLGSDEVIEGLTLTSENETPTLYQVTAKASTRDVFWQQVKRERNSDLENQMYISYWDFAGQSTYYSTHQAFLAPRAVYIVVFDLSKDLNENLKDSLCFRTGIQGKCTVKESLQFWASSIKAYTKDVQGGRAPLILVGTHADKVTDEKIIEERFRQARDAMGFETIEWMKINNTIEIKHDGSQDDDPEDLKQLRNTVLELGLGIADEEVDAQWIDLENELYNKKMTGAMVITFQELKELDKTMDRPMQDDKNLKLFLEHLHCRGQVLYFPVKSGTELIILEPSALANLLNSLLRAMHGKQSVSNLDAESHQGIVSKEFIDKKMTELLSKNPSSGNALVAMLENLKIMMRYDRPQNQVMYIIPSLLPAHETTRIGSRAYRSERVVNLEIKFKKSNVPHGFYHLFIVSLITGMPGIEIFKKGNDIQLYNLYTMLELETGIVELFWEGSGIYVAIDCEEEEDMQKGNADITTLVDGITKAVKDTLLIYRQNGINFYVGVECPQHKGLYIDINKLRESGRAKCVPPNTSWHFVKTKECFKKLIKTFGKMPAQNPVNEKHLARLANKLSKDRSKELAMRLQMEGCDQIAREVEANYSNHSVRRLHIFKKWMAVRDRQTTVNDLVGYLTVSKDYERDDVTSSALEEPSLKTFATEVNLDQDITERDCAIVSSHIDIGEYPLLMIELGIPLNTILEIEHNCRGDVGEIISQLLIKWKKTYPHECTRKKLLSVVSHLQMPTKDILSSLSGLKVETS
ncbi:uncharacterized protein LOC128202891 [Mya arenaria]|uniref:uncharacterized protein LOC128202891 n=1 Tax=Mya arenaria TaxID=6604 RepID=UPI0022E7981D|nr:uncharacterized protein LOC128202891 [Mya arenaria]